MLNEGQLLWTPREEFAASSNIARYQRWLQESGRCDVKDYDGLWRWSVGEPEAFWNSIWDFFDVQYEGSRGPAMTPQTHERGAMLGVKWFVGARLNYAEHMLRHEARATPEEIAFHHLTEARPLATLTWRELGRQVRILATRLRAMGVTPGDRVVSYMPNVPEAAIAMMASVAIGAIWSSAAIEFGVRTVVERFSQITPKVLFAADGYRFGGKDFSRAAQVQRLAAELPSLDVVVWLPHLNSRMTSCDMPRALSWSQMMDHEDVPAAEFRYTRVPHYHPIWILFSSGTTGPPKAIVHSHVGVLLEHLKLAHLHLNLHPGSVMSFYSTT